VLKFTLVDDRHRFETAMRVLSHTASRLGWSEAMRAGVVKQQEWIKPVPFVVGE